MSDVLLSIFSQSQLTVGEAQLMVESEVRKIKFGLLVNEMGSVSLVKEHKRLGSQLKNGVL